VTYFQFLGEWYNLPWLAAVVAGLLAAMRARRARRSDVPVGPEDSPEPKRPLAPRTSPAVLLVTSGVVGLTLNGAIHDLRLGSAGARFPLVAVLSLGTGWLVAWGGSRLRHRVAPPITGLAFNRPGLEGGEAVVLGTGTEPDGTPRARHRDAAGVAHIVRIRFPVDADPHELRFGRKVRLDTFDPELGVYHVTLI
jgi:hypothetical protein